MTNNKIMPIFLTLMISALIFSACSSGQNSELEKIRKKLTQVEQKLTNMTSGAWIPTPNSVYQPSVKSTIDDLAKVNYEPPSSIATNLVAMGKNYMKAGDFNAAFSTFQQASKVDETNPEVYFWLGYLLPAVGGPKEVAILSLNVAIAKDTSQDKFIAMFSLRQRGIFSIMTGDDSSALSDFSECIQIGSQSENKIPIFWQSVYINRSIAYQFLGKTYEGLQDYSKVLDLVAIQENPDILPKIQERLDEIDAAIK
jgi:tetratricopeptide (TPR) repeat protein